MLHTRKPRIGIIGMGHSVYWAQFDGLLDELRENILRLRHISAMRWKRLISGLPMISIHL